MQTIFEQALSLTSPWYIDEISFSLETQRLDIYVNFERGTHFSIDDSSVTYPVHDTVDKEWRHLNFFEHECYLHCRTPRVKKDDGKVQLISPPWAGKTNGFSLLFEAFLLQLCKHMPINVVAKTVAVSDDKLWRMLDKYVSQTRELEDFSDTIAVGIDETSRAKGHTYITLFVDLDERRTIFITDGKDSGTVRSFAKDFKAHKGSVAAVKDVTCDMSKAFIKGVKESLPQAEITFDKFHIIKIINEALDAIRRREVGQNPILKGERYTFLKSPSNLTAYQQRSLQELSKQKYNLQTYRALEIRDAFMDIYKIKDNDLFESRLNEWYSWARRCRIPEMKKVARTIKNHWDGVLRWRVSGLSNGILEGLNSLIQAAKSKARGYRTTKNFKIIAYLVTGRLDFGTINRFFQP
jgi:transposase